MYLSLRFLSVLSLIVACLAENSTYTNPIIPGFHPDPSCVFVPEWNNTFFCVASSFLVFPGLPIHASRDLQNWKLVSNALSRPDQLPGLAFLPVSTSGIYAPTLRFHDNTFYLTSTLVNQGLPRENDSRWDNFVMTSTDPYNSSAWSDPVHFPFPGFDTSPFWDDDGQLYITGSHTASVYPGIPHRNINLETGEVGAISFPWNGTGGNAPEGPHFFKRDGYYYLLLAEGGTAQNHMVTMARSKDINGPYEPHPSNPVLTNANTSAYFQAVGHADLFQDAQSQWWAVALSVRSGANYSNFPMGRETVLTSVTWEEGQWPIFSPVSGKMSGWQFPPTSQIVEGEGQLANTSDCLDFAPGSAIPPHLVHWRLPVTKNYRISPEGHPNTLGLRSSVLNLTAVDGDYAWGRGQTFISRRQTDTLFVYSVHIDASALQKEESEVGVSAFLDQSKHFDLGIVLLKQNNKSNNTSDLAPHIRFRGISGTPVEEMVYAAPQAWLEQPLALQIRTVNRTYYSLSAGPASDESEMQTFGYFQGTQLTPRFSGTLVGVYATTNGKHGEGAFEAYVSNWTYTGLGQIIE